MAIQNKSFNQVEESPVKHTSAAEMPDTSQLSSLSRRVSADLSVFRSKVSSKYLLWSLVSAGVGFGVYYFIKKYRNSNLQSE